MIRPFTLFCKLNQITFTDKQWVQKEIECFYACAHACPYCNAKGPMKLFAHYDRYLIELKANQPVVYSLTVPRYCCDSCGHTHAILPSALVPYRSYSLRFILHVMRSYFLHQMTVEVLCSHYGIAAATLYSWKALFLCQKALWLGVLEDIRQEESTFMAEMDGQFLKGFHDSFRFSFLENRNRTDKEMPFGTQKNPPGIT